MPERDDDPERTTPYGTPEPSDTTADWAIPDSTLRALRQRYDLLDEVGHGGMGIVYRARDRETGDTVALKVLKPEIAARPDVIERFKAELLLARKITHKNICRTYELLRFGSTVAIAMEFVEGESLRAVLERFGGVPLRRGLEWAGQVCAGLAEAHAQGVVHRDLKPENILIDRRGQAKVMDFGIARSFESDATKTGTLIGTPAYMSPEQVEGKPPDGRSDIYSLGHILFEMFCGRRAFQADTPVALALKQIQEAPPSPRSLEPHLPPFLDQAIQRCLEKNPKKRFESVSELVAALSDQPEAAPALTEPEPTEVPLPLHLARWQRSDFALLGVGVIGAALLFALFNYAFPYSTVKVLPRHKAEQAVKEGLAKLGVEASPDNARLGIGLDAYSSFVKLAGTTVSRNALTEGLASKWIFPFTSPTTPGRYVGTWVVNQTGQTVRVWLSVRPNAVAGNLTEAEARVVAARLVREILGKDVASGTPASEFFIPDSFSYDYEFPDPYGVGAARASVSVDRDDFSATYHTGIELQLWQQRFWYSPRRGDTGLIVVAALVLGVFFYRRLNRRPTSWSLFVLVLGGTALAFSTFHNSVVWKGWLTIPQVFRMPWERELPPEWALAGRIVLEALLFVLLLGAAYCILRTAEYYAKRRQPQRLRSFSDVLTHPIRNHPAGLALVRGALLGLRFAGVAVAVFSLTSWQRLVIPHPGWLMHVASGLYSYFPSLERIDPFGVALRSFTVPFLEAILLPWALVALPMALLGRVVARPIALVGLVAAVWMAVGYSLQGLSCFPTWGLYLFIALQGAFLASVYHRWDALTAMAAVFTVETWLVGYAMQQTFRTIGSLWYWLPVGLWLAFVLFGLALFLRPQLGAAYRRVAAVFE